MASCLLFGNTITRTPPLDGWWTACSFPATSRRQLFTPAATSSYSGGHLSHLPGLAGSHCQPRWPGATLGYLPRLLASTHHRPPTTWAWLWLPAWATSLNLLASCDLRANTGRKRREAGGQGGRLFPPSWRTGEPPRRLRSLPRAHATCWARRHSSTWAGGWLSDGRATGWPLPLRNSGQGAGAYFRLSRGRTLDLRHGWRAASSTIFLSPLPSGWTEEA